MNQNLVYLNYWKRKELLRQGVPKFPLLRWWDSLELCEVEKVIFNYIEKQDVLLDIGAGDLKVTKKYQQAGYSGSYHTQDIGNEFEYTYKNLSEITHKYSAILCLDVIEHLQLPEGLALIHQLNELLLPGGVLIVQTPNGRCIRSPLSSDMTHVHCYNLDDLWAYLTCMQFAVKGYRVVFELKKQTYIKNILNSVSRYIITRFLGLDYADNIVLVGKKI